MNGESRDKALSFVKLNGPVQPVAISKHLSLDLIMSGALLSELVSSKKVKITNVKRGGSPYYYTEGQEAKLQQLSEHLNEREKEAYELLKEKKVLRDNESTPVERVALRAIKDYAIPLDVEVNDQIERFWKWYVIDDETVRNEVSRLLNIKEPIEDIPVKESVVEERKVDLNEDKKEIEKPIEVKKPEILEKKKEVIQKPVIEQKVLAEAKPKGGFYDMINRYFNNNGIKISFSEIIRKEREVNYIGEIMSSIGNLRYYIKVRNKQKLNEGDLSLAWNEGQQHKLPVLFLSTGDLTKKAKEYAEKNWKGQLIFRKLE